MDILNWLRNQWDRAGAVMLFVLGALAMLLGWIGVSGSLYPAEAMPYIISGGFFGVLCAGAGATLWISADLRDEFRKLDQIEAAWLAAGKPGELPPANPVQPDVARHSRNGDRADSPSAGVSA